jgi:proteasome lid subunit RPN8/RPN11
MSDHEIEFGEVEQTQRLQQLRPDCNRQLAVVACGRVASCDLPIFVDLDALRDMETHALSNIRVELGGVLLGGQFEDQEGQPYVVVGDSLRARHYESSKGSFKFTHDTWSDITRRRDDFPQDLQMVGWYHTHPDWGVFLSGMDLFICDNFFNRPLDVALVIDPCRGDRGWFQWTGDPAERTRRTGGFYIYASRHRQAELHAFAAYLEGEYAMTHDPRSGGPAYPGSAYPVVVTQPSDARSGWLALGVMGMLSTQFLLLVLIAWRLVLVPPGDVDTRNPAEPASASANNLERQNELDVQSQQIEAKIQMLDRAVAALETGGPQGVVALLDQERRELDRVQNDLRVYRLREAEAHAINQGLNRELHRREQDLAGLRKRLETRNEEIATSRARERELKDENVQLRADLAVAQRPDGEPGGEEPFFFEPLWMWIGGGAVLMMLAGLTYAIAVSKPGGRRRLDEHETESSFRERTEDRDRQTR